MRRRPSWRRRLLGVAVLLALAAAALVAFAPKLGDGDGRGGEVAGLAPLGAGPSAEDERSERERRRDSEHRARKREESRYALADSPARPAVEHEFKQPPRAGLMFDVDSGEILWERHPDRELAIASLTKMMTALLIADRHRPGEQVRISRNAARTDGSKVGVLPQGKRVRLEPLLNGLLLVSGNDAAVALAEHDAGSVGDFVKRMNRRADELGLRCTRFSSPHGLQDAGNRSCPRDLAALARADLATRRIRRIVGSDRERFKFPVEGGALDLFNNNPFIRMGDGTITGVKTGYTDAAGRCYVTTAKRGGRHLGVVLLHSPDPIKQVPKLLDLGAKA